MLYFSFTDSHNHYFAPFCISALARGLFTIHRLFTDYSQTIHSDSLCSICSLPPIFKSVYDFIFGRAGSLLLLQAAPGCGAWWLLLLRSAGSSLWRLLLVRSAGSGDVGFTSCRTRAPCISRWILNHWTAREVLAYFFIPIWLCQKSIYLSTFFQN